MTDFSTWLIALRRWTTDAERFTDSAIVYDVLLHAYDLQMSRRNQSMKDLYRSVPHSESRVRSIIRLLESEGLIEIRTGADGRRRSFVCTPRLNGLMVEYRERLKACP